MITSRAQQISAIDSQLSRPGLPQANINGLISAKSNLSSQSLSGLDNLSSYSYRIQSKANMIPCGVVETILQKLDSFADILETTIDDAFGDSLDSITQFASDTGQAILDATSIDEGLEAVTESVKEFSKQIGVMTGLNMPEVSDECLKQIAQKTYQYLPHEKQQEIDMLNSLTQEDKQTTIKSMTKNLGAGKFNFI